MYIVIAGGGKVGSYLANVLLESGNEVAVIEQNKQLADALSVALEGRYLIICGDCCDSRFQEDAGIRSADIFVGATGQDDTNLVACEIAHNRAREQPEEPAHLPQGGHRVRVIHNADRQSDRGRGASGQRVGGHVALAWQCHADRIHCGAYAAPFRRRGHLVG